MNEEELNRLIERYYNGQSSEEEERSLKAFFSTNSPAGYEAEKEIFSYFQSPSIPEASPDLETRIISRIESLEADRGFLRRFLLPVGNIAAGFLILAGLYFFLNERSKSVDSFSDPAIAYAETMKILFTVSEQLNKGESVMKPFGKLNEIRSNGFKAISESSDKIEKSMNLLNKQFENAGEQLENKRNIK